MPTNLILRGQCRHGAGGQPGYPTSPHGGLSITSHCKPLRCRDQYPRTTPRAAPASTCVIHLSQHPPQDVEQPRVTFLVWLDRLSLPGIRGSVFMCVCGGGQQQGGAGPWGWAEQWDQKRSIGLGRNSGVIGQTEMVHPHPCQESSEGWSVQLFSGVQG